MGGNQPATDRSHGKVWLAGIWVFSMVLILDAYQDLLEIFQYDCYRVMQADLPDWLVCVRYVVSVTLRILMLWAVAGILTRREQYRKLLLGLCWFNVLMVFAHHRYPSFVYISNYLGLNSEDFQQTVRWFGHWYYPGAVVRMLTACFREFFLAGITIQFFMYPKVKKLFQ